MVDVGNGVYYFVNLVSVWGFVFAGWGFVMRWLLSTWDLGTVDIDDTWVFVVDV